MVPCTKHVHRCPVALARSSAVVIDYGKPGKPLGERFGDAIRYAAVEPREPSGKGHVANPKTYPERRAIRSSTAGGSSIAEDRKVEPTKALAVGEEVDPGDLPARDREADCDARPSAAAPTRVPRLHSRAPDEPAHGSSSLALYRWDALATTPA
jgi:hypothetical protein